MFPIARPHRRHDEVALGVEMLQMCDALFDIHIIIRYLRAAYPLLGEHLPLPRQQPEFVDLGEFADDTVGDVQRNAVVAPLYLIEVFAARQADI